MKMTKIQVKLWEEPTLILIATKEVNSLDKTLMERD
jgi:hypothetical protein